MTIVVRGSQEIVLIKCIVPTSDCALPAIVLLTLATILSSTLFYEVTTALEYASLTYTPTQLHNAVMHSHDQTDNCRSKRRCLLMRGRWSARAHLTLQRDSTSWLERFNRTNSVQQPRAKISSTVQRLQATYHFHNKITISERP